MRPSQLAQQLTQIIADACGVDVVWPSRSLTIAEMARISARIERRLESAATEVSACEQRQDG